MALTSKVALVTGAAKGLGKGFSEILLKNGAKVALLDINEAAGKELKSAFDKQYGVDSTIFQLCDVSSEVQLKEAFRKTVEFFGKLDITCNNAGITNEQKWEKTVAINLNGVIRGTYLALQYMKKENGGQGGVIVNVASMAGLGPFLSVPVYTATKHGVVGFSRAMADASQLCDYGVRINILCPAFVRTDIVDSLSADDRTGQFSLLKAYTHKLVETHGMLEVSEVAEGFLQLVTDESKNGAAMRLTKKTGCSFMEFPSFQ
ncbi:15-hydroxyprostaglandin dehydrogenase [NAD(+)] [Amia ocellicauda]|uniref:15-hydroxyprostaglandin dehydrogenase [NAD(+)] n=1 Tax=Amia ocellicauda TaxID=2972642 RepID=UPI003463BB81|nr:PGDH dehydrogenase [Amia calva]